MLLNNMLTGKSSPALATRESSDSHSNSEGSSERGADRELLHLSFRKKNPIASRPSSTPGPQHGFIVAQNDHSKIGTTVRQILDHPQISVRFKQYAASLHADEGLIFLDDLQEAHEVSDQRAAADALMHKFFLDDAEHEINLADQTRSELIERFTDDNYANVAELFNEATYEIFTDIKKSDTFRNFILIDEDAKRISTDESLLLDSWLVQENFRTALQAIQDDPILCNFVRFCSSVSEFEKEDDKVSKRARGNKIASTFIQAGSTFQIQLPKYYQEAIVKGNYVILPDARTEMIQVLSKNHSLMEAVRTSLTQVRQSTSQSQDHSVSSHTQELQSLFTHGGGPALVQKLIELDLEGKHSGLINKVRFCSAIVAALNTPGTFDHNQQKLGLARKAVANYVQAGSRFQVELAPGFVEDLCEDKHARYESIFNVLYSQYLSELGTTVLVNEALDSLHL